MLKLIKTSKGVLALLTNMEQFPCDGWLAIQRVKPLKNAKWFRAYPIKGGSMLVQVGRFEVIREATQADIDEACTGHGFNPAANSILQLIG